jgi:hypothetical protein
MRGQQHASASHCPQERIGTHCTGGWVGRSVRTKNLAPTRIFFYFTYLLPSFVYTCYYNCLSVNSVLWSTCWVIRLPVQATYLLTAENNSSSNSKCVSDIWFYRSPDRPDRSQSLYRLSYQAHKLSNSHPE